MKTMMKRNVLLICSALAAARAPAHAGGLGVIEGSVVNASGAVLASGVRIVIRCGDVTRTVAPDRAGHFAASGLPEGTCTLTSSGAGFETLTLQIAVAAGSIATVLVGMRPPMPPAPVSVATPSPAMPEAVAAEPAPRRVHREPPRPMPMPADAKPGAAPPRIAKPVGRAGAGGRPVAGARAVAADMPMQRAQLRPMPAQERAKRGEAFARDGLDELGGLEIANNEQIAGWAPVRVFPVPQYTKGYDGPRTDFRETIYWNGNVETGADGTAEVSFVMSDAVTAFRATAEGFSAGGAAGGGEVAVASKLPLSLEAKLPLEVSAGDRIQLPVTLANETEDDLEATLDARFGAALRLAGASPAAGSLRLRAGERRSFYFPLDVVAQDGDADVALTLATRGLRDELKKTIRVVPRGFPFVAAASGTARGDRPGRAELDLAGALPGTIRATVTMYPSPLAAMTQGLEGMIREPGGCFEQTSSSNYPNTMILSYLQSTDAADPALVGKTLGVLDRGYKLLTGFETPVKGYEWFGKAPGHEALTAYGLMEFADMAKVYDVDPKMVERTAAWLMSRRDGKGGFSRSAQALDTFGRAGEATTNAYILWALAEAGRTAGLDRELAAQRALGASTADPYLLALAANTALLVAPRAPETAAMVKRLAAMQAKDGGFPGAQETITKSGGESLVIETTALAALAFVKTSESGEHAAQLRAAVDWINARRGGYGQWGNTQATILGLKALTAYSNAARQMQAPGAATLVVNGKRLGTIEFDKGRREALVWDDVAGSLAAGKNVVELELTGGATLPYTVSIEYRAARPQSSPRAKVAVAAELGKARVKMGEGVTLRAHVENRTAEGIPMTLARVGIPGGLVTQTWQLKELRDKGLIDFYETRPREVILYWRALPPSAKKDVDLQLLAAVPGTYEAPASSAYLYYTAEDKAWSPPVAFEVTR
ncbi:MAG TPA: alpha-2-macroglobulin family protein [Kofleriaceae bacterium]|nr:alpha-2-macroglobulin family protein [Kofleriaceae bacterium]